MNNFEAIKNFQAPAFKRITGISIDQFNGLLDKIKAEIEKEAFENPIHRRGLKSKISLADKLLITLYYLRSYHTFFEIATQFGLSESYVYKIFRKISAYLIKINHVGGKKDLQNPQLWAIAVDVTEQEIERPKKNQRAYYSGKKNGIPLKHNLL